MAAVRVLVVDDQPPFRVAASGFELVGEASSGEEAVERVAALAPDLVLMDITMPGMGGIAATRAITAVPDAPVVFFCSTYAEADLPSDALDSGAAGYIGKDALAADLLTRLWGEARSSPDGTPASTA